MIPKMMNCELRLLWILLFLFIQKSCSACIETKGCHLFPNEKRYSCSEVTPWSEDVRKKATITKLNVEILELCNLHSRTLHLNDFLKHFPGLKNITVFQGNITTLTGSFPPKNDITTLQFRNLSIEEIPDDFLNLVNDINQLYLTGNKLNMLHPSTIQAMNKIPEVYLAGNHWNCSGDLEWVLRLNRSNVKDAEELKCFQPYPEKPLIPTAQFKKNVLTQCPPECECWLSDVVRDPSNLKLEPIIEVNCSDRGLTELPPQLPAQTKVLMLERNSITHLDALINNPLYKEIQDVYLDNNYVDSIDELEGTYWFSHFRVLSLSNNRLSQLPTYALDNALQQNPNMPVAVRIFLGNNPWRCDCAFTPGFQEMLQKYETQVRDVSDIRCSYVEGDENSLTLIFELSRSSVCRLPNEYSLRVLDLLNGVLATLIVLILSKLAYDYYYFKKTGRLPWIVTKMP